MHGCCQKNMRISFALLVIRVLFLLFNANRIPAQEGRRCLGDFLATYQVNGSNDGRDVDNKSKHATLLDWLNENTSCDIIDNNTILGMNNNNNNDDYVENVVIITNEMDLPYHVVMPLMENHHIHYEYITGLLVFGFEGKYYVI